MAADGQEGVELALQEVPDIIISDVMMPRRDGLEVCRILKADERTSHIPIILLTARAAIEDKIQGIRRGADAYLSKPFHREELDAHLEQLLIQRRRLQEHFRRPDAPPPGEAERPEAAFLQKVRACILEHLEEENFGVEELAEALFLSRTQLFRKVKALTGRNVAAFIHQVRIGQVKQLLASTGLTVSEIAFQTGFSEASYLRKVFLKETGETLADFRKKFRKG
ncbi:MAG: DNA-binding response regulator [Phaeodactylibacter sp.]|nr:DNA-binding response regulator [Phaeodactylibacter sp.]